MADTTANLPSSATVSSRGARADAVVRVTAIIALIMVGLQFLLAGFSIFGAGFEMHVMLGRLLGVWTLVPLVAVLFARAGARDIVIAVVLSILAIGVQGMLAQIGMSNSIPLLGALHVLNGFFIGGLASQLLAHATARQKLRAQAT